MLDSSIESTRRSDRVVVLLIAAIVFTLHAALANRWDSLGVLDQYNVLFDADPRERTQQFAHGWPLAGFNHPLLPYLFSLPLRALASIASALGLIDDGVGFRESAALYIPPLFSAIKAATLFVTFRVLGLSSVDAVMASAISALSFSSVIFGSLPDSYAVSGAGLALITLFSLMNYESKRPSRRGKVSLALAGLLSIGTTVSNVIHHGWMTCLSLIDEERKPAAALIRSVAGAAALLLTTLLLSWSLALGQEGDVDHSRFMLSKEFVGQYTPELSEQLANGGRFPEMLARSVVPTIPRQKDNPLAIKQGDAIQFELTFNGIGIDLGTIALWLTGILILGGAVVAYRLGDLWRWAGLASAASVLTSGALFSWFGTNTFLYSQYWQVPAAILVGAWVHFVSDRFALGRRLLVALVLILAAGDLYVLSVIDAALTSR